MRVFALSLLVGCGAPEIVITQLDPGLPDLTTGEVIDAWEAVAPGWDLPGVNIWLAAFDPDSRLSGLYHALGHNIWLMEQWGGYPALAHELFHHRLWLQNLNPDPDHTHKDWALWY